MFVLGSKGDAAMVQLLTKLAVYISNLFFFTSDANVPVIKDTDLTDQVAGEKHYSLHIHVGITLIYRFLQNKMKMINVFIHEYRFNTCIYM